jgi:NADH-ubiquinone oxidoreductase chain 3
MLGSTLFFLIFIPFLAFVLLALSVILSPQKPYSQKSSPFECGFSSFRGQNRTEFNISFFVFGLLFLLFDLEILLIYPYAVSSYNNSSFGLFVVIIFLLILTAGFVFEFGHGALKINSKQTGYLESYNTEVNLSNKSNLYPHQGPKGTRSFSTCSNKRGKRGQSLKSPALVQGIYGIIRKIRQALLN